MKFGPASAAPGPTILKPGRFRVWLQKAKKALVVTFAFLIWAAFQAGMQSAIAITVTAIADFQKSGRRA